MCPPHTPSPPPPVPPDFLLHPSLRLSLCHQSFFTFSSSFLSTRRLPPTFLLCCILPPSLPSPPPPPPPSPPPPHPSVSHRQRVIRLHWPRRMCCFDSRGLRRSERKESSNPMTAKTHYRWENTSDHQLREPIPRSAQQTGGINCCRRHHRPPQSRHHPLTGRRCESVGTQLTISMTLQRLQVRVEVPGSRTLPFLASWICEIVFDSWPSTVSGISARPRQPIHHANA